MCLRRPLGLLRPQPLVGDQHGAQQCSHRPPAADVARSLKCVLIRLAEIAGDDRLDQRGAELAAAFRFGNVEQPGEERSEEHTSELQSLMRISYAVFCLKKKTIIKNNTANRQSKNN